MKKNAKFAITCSILLAGGVLFLGFQNLNQSNQAVSHSVKTVKKEQNKNSSRIPLATATNKKSPNVTKVDWHGPSMPNRAYPNIQKHPDLQVKVSIAQQRVFLKEHGKVLYTMLASTGKSGDDTPKGNFQIEPERGTHFYNAGSGEGANYWVSFKDHGIFLFHSVPVDSAGNYITSEAEQLGKKPLSHGCVRLSIADAKWMYENIRQSTPVDVS